MGVYLTVFSIVSMCCVFLATAFQTPYSAELVFPLDANHNHAPGIVELPNGDLLTSWYRGSGERKADDVVVLGSRKKKGESKWSEPFLMVDTPDFPDCNTCMMIDSSNRLWLFWPVIIANTWESCLTNALVSEDYTSDGAPVWKRRDVLFLKPKDFGPSAKIKLEQFLAKANVPLTDKQKEVVALLKSRLDDKLYQRLGWQPRCKPTVLKNGRILLPLYSDTYSISLMAYSDDSGVTWKASEPLIGFGNIQPAVLERADGSLIAYMRENGITGKIQACESVDRGETWGDVYSMSLPNPGSGVDALRLSSGKWALVYNDTEEGRSSLVVSLSDDEGKSWKWTRSLEKQPGGSFHYPAMTQGKDGRIHVIYSYFVPEGKSMKHFEFTEAWLSGTN